MVLASSTLEALIATKKARIAVIGLGYAGLPAAAAFARAGFSVLGIDVDEAKVAQVNEGRSYLQDLPSSDLAVLVRESGPGPWPRLVATTDATALSTVDVAQICVPTPCTKNKEPDTRHIEAAARAVTARGRSNQLVVLRSTSYPGTTRELVLPILESMGRRVGADVYLAFVPERIDPGRRDPPVDRVPVIVGGVDAESTRLAQLLFAQVAETVVPVSSAEAAEMAKLLENVFRNVNIALVNQLAVLCDRMGLDVWEIVDAAATKPFGFMKFLPGPGVGGHCIPVDPYYLAWKAREYDFHMDFIELAARVNDEMPYFVVNKALDALSGGRGMKRVLVVGVTFKRDVADERHSPALKIIELLHRRGVDVAYHDPYIDSVHVNETVLSSEPLTSEVLAAADAVIIATDHSRLDYQWIVDNARRVIDTRNATRSVVRGRERITKL